MTDDDPDGLENHDEEWPTDDEPDWEDQEPAEDDYVTEDHRRFYQYGKLAVTVPQDDDWRSHVKAHMDRERFWPGVYLISDHGNAHPLDVEE